MAKRGGYIVGLDVGTSKVCILVCELRDDGVLSVLGWASAPTGGGFDRGKVSAMEPVIEAIKKVVSEAELMSNIVIDKVFASVGGTQVIGLNSRGVITVSSQCRRVTRDDINRVLEASKGITVPANNSILHVIPQEFVVDDQNGIADPIGMLCRKLEVNSHIVACNNIALGNVIECINRAGIAKVVPVLEQLADSMAVLQESEKKLGVAVVDIGAGTSSLAVFGSGSLWYSCAWPIGGINFTSDIAIGIRTSVEEAERIKRKYASASPTFCADDETIEVHMVAGSGRRVLSRQIINEIAKPRAEQIFSKIRDELKKVDLLNHLTAGIVLTGGGAMLDGLVDHAQAIFDLNVRIGKPMGIEDLNNEIDNPAFSTVVGLVKYGAESIKLQEKYELNKSLLRRIIDAVKLIFR